MNKVFGYARVSTKDQNEERQLIALRKAGVIDSQIYIDKKSGKDFHRPAWKRLKRKLKAGDLLVITSIDRFGRNYEEILSEWRLLVKLNGVHIRVLDMPLLDTTTANGLLAVFIADLVLQILSFVAQSERDHIKERQRQGIDAAKARGVKFGRPPIIRPKILEEIVNLLRQGKISTSKGAALVGVSRTTFRRWARST